MIACEYGVPFGGDKSVLKLTAVVFAYPRGHIKKH